MDQTRPHRTSLLQLAAQWKLLALMAVAQARRIVRGQRLGARGALTEAQILEAWLQMAILQVNAEIAAAPEGLLPPEEQEALDLLKTIAIGLMILLVAGHRHRNGRSHMTRRLLGLLIDFRLWWPDTADRRLLFALRFGFGVKSRRHTAYRALHIVGLVLKLT